MALPVLVRAYTGNRSPSTSTTNDAVQSLPPISSYAFADILRSADCPDFQHAIDGIAEICAKNRMSLADEYASHLPPLGEITAATSQVARPHMIRPGMRRPLTSVPEASSGSSEGSRKSKKKGGMFNFTRRQGSEGVTARKIRIGSMGRTIAVGGIVGLVTADESTLGPQCHDFTTSSFSHALARPPMPQRASSAAAASLQRLLAV